MMSLLLVVVGHVHVSVAITMELHVFLLQIVLMAAVPMLLGLHVGVVLLVGLMDANLEKTVVIVLVIAIVLLVHRIVKIIAVQIIKVVVQVLL
jgi:hypothetical protein